VSSPGYLSCFETTFTNGRLSCAAWNCHSLTHKTADVATFCQDKKVDIFGVVETWLGPTVKSSTLNLKGYQLLRRDRPAQDGAIVYHGGVAAYINKNIKFKQLGHLEQDNMECIWFEVESMRSKITVGIVYKPPAQNTYEFIEYLEGCVGRLGRTPTLILGDFNINWQLQNNPHVDTLQTLLSLYSFEQLINNGTHVYNGFDNQPRETSIDLICVNRPQMVEQAEVMDYDPGQLEYHRPVIVRYRATALPLKKEVRRERNFSGANVENFKRMLATRAWSGASVDEAVKGFNDTLSQMLDRCFPIKEFTVTEKSLPHITPEIRIQIEIKYQLLRRKRETHRDEDRLAYNRQCDRVRLLCSQHRTKCMEDEITENTSNGRKLWQTIKYYLPVGKIKDKSSIKLTRDGVDVGNELEVAREFNSFFVTVAQQLADQIPVIEGDPLVYVPAPREGATFSLNQTCEDEVRNEINAIASGKAIAGPIPMRILKHATDFITPPLTRIINLSFAEATVPHDLKKATVSCIFKEGTKTDVANYRGISVLPLPAKIMESIVQRRLSRFLEEKGILYSHQSAFRKNHSCEMALNETLEQIYGQLERGREVLVVFLDLRRAFDTIDRSILFRKLDRIGVRGHSLNWFKSLLSDRTQTVKIGNHISEPLGANIGVPQGGGLGPLLFSVYINDIAEACHVPETLLFADDTALVFTDVASQTVNDSLSRFYKWLCLNKLTLNTGKTKFMLFSKKTHPTNPEILINGEPIERVDEIKYLGVIIDKNLSFGSHIDKTAKGLNFLHSVLYKNRSFVKPAIGKILINALAVPKLQYCASVFHRVSGNSLAKLDIIYRKLIKTVYRLDHDATTALVYGPGNFLPLCLLRQIQAASFAFRCETGICAVYLTQKIRSTEAENLRRRPGREAAPAVERYVVPRCRLDVAGQSYVAWAPRILNTIPVDVLDTSRIANNPIKSFTAKYKNIIITEFRASYWERSFETNRPLEYFVRRLPAP
jgi:hypothetical protein